MSRMTRQVKVLCYIGFVAFRCPQNPRFGSAESCQFDYLSVCCVASTPRNLHIDLPVGGIMLYWFRRASMPRIPRFDSSVGVCDFLTPSDVCCATLCKEFTTTGRTDRRRTATTGRTRRDDGTDGQRTMTALGRTCWDGRYINK